MVDLSNTFDVSWDMAHKTLRQILDSQRLEVVTQMATRMRRKGSSYAQIGLELGYTRQYIFYLLNTVPKKKRARI